MGNGEPPAPDDLARYASMDEEELFAEIGAARLGDTLGIRTPEFGRYVRAGRRWFEENYDRLHVEICDSEKVRSLHAALGRDATLDAAAIADALTSVALGGVPVAAVAVIVAKRGLATFCGWQDERLESS